MYSYFGLFIFSFVVGMSLGLWSEKQDQIRNPASVRKSYEYTILSSAFSEAFKQKFIEETTFVAHDDSIDFKMGQYYVKSSVDSIKTFICDEYSNIEFSFEADGIAVNGERPKMLVTSPCARDRVDDQQIAAVELPIKQILSEKSVDGDLNFNDQNLQISFTNMPESWPTSWHLIHVRFKNQNDDKNQTITREEFKKNSKRAMVLDWTKHLN